MGTRSRMLALFVGALATSACANAEATEAPAVADQALAAAEGTPSVAGQPAVATGDQLAEAGPTMTVFKTPSCGCCSIWADHMREAGFVVEVHDANSLADVKRQSGVPDDLHSCHTAIVQGLVVEGHVPAETIKDVLADRQGLKGIAVPGMPIGSPGMEMPGRAADPYEVVGFGEDGTRTVVARH